MAGCGEASVSVEDRPGLDTMLSWEVVYTVGKGAWTRSHTPVPVMLQTLARALSAAAVWIGKPAGEREPEFELVALCKNLPNAIFRCLNDAEMETGDENRAHVFEVLCTLVEFTGAFLCECVEVGEELCLPALKNILQALSFALDSNMRYYSKPEREILVLPSRLGFALQVPGCVVRLFDDDDKSRKHYFCAEKGVSNLASCECCNLPSKVDTVVVSVCWHLASASYELLLKVLRTKKIVDALEMEMMALVMRPLAEVLIDHSSWRVVIQHLEESFAGGDMMRSCCLAFYNVFQSLKKALVEKSPFDGIFSSRKAFMKILVYLDAVKEWISASERDDVSWVEDPGELMLSFLKRIDESKADDVECRVLGELLDCAQGLRYEVPFVTNILHKLNFGGAILRCLKSKCDVKMVQLVEFAGKQGLIMKDNVFLEIINPDVSGDEQGTLEERHARDQVVATILKNFKLDSFGPSAKRWMLLWLESSKATDSLCCILEKLADCDKLRHHKSRLLGILYKHAFDLPANDTMSCMTKIASHYTSAAEPKTMILPGEETEKLLRACSTADFEWSVSRHVGSKFEDKAVIEQRVKTYQDMEVNFHLETSCQLQRLLDINIPLSVYEPSAECLKRLELAQQLISGLETTTSKNMASVVSSAVSPELRALEAIKKEIASRPEACQKMQDAQERHLKEYDALKRDHCNIVKKFLQKCLEVKERIVRDTLYAKAEVLAAIEMAKLQSKTESSPDVIRTRVFQKVETTLEEVEERHRKSLETQPNRECNVCFLPLQGTRKRACFDPCGHAGTCLDCGLREWKRKKACPLCRRPTVKPVAVPSALFFS